MGLSLAVVFRTEYAAMMVELASRRSLAPRSVLCLPLGALEQHGGRLPLGTDLLIAGAVARKVVYESGEPRLVLGPTLPYGCSAHHLEFGAALSVESGTLLTVLEDVFQSARLSGFSGVFVLNGHGGNTGVVTAAMSKAASVEMPIAGGDYWALAEWATPAKEALPGLNEVPVPGHAGAFEALLLSALDVDGVDGPYGPRGPQSTVGGLQADFGRFLYPKSLVWDELGSSDRGDSDNAALGAKVLDWVTIGVTASLRAFLATLGGGADRAGSTPSSLP